MRRMSSLPIAERCPGADTIGKNIETTNALRGTVFHAYCATGQWPSIIGQLPQEDVDRIKSWHVPTPFGYGLDGVIHPLSYGNALKEVRVALDHDFNYVDVPDDVPQSEIAERHPNVMVCGTLDMAWVLRERDLVILCDIKSTIFAVQDRTESLQLHGYGMAIATKLGIGRYTTAIWDASEGKYHVRPGEAIELDGFEAADLRERIRFAASDRGDKFTAGEHCSGCFKRPRCPAHLIDVPESEFADLLAGRATSEQVRLAVIRVKQLRDLAATVDDECKSWVKRNGPLRSADGKKQYMVSMRQGRQGTDYGAVARDLGLENLDKYKTEGQPYEAFDWRNVK